MHRIAAQKQVVGKLTANQAGANHQHRLGRRAQCRVEGGQILQMVDCANNVRRIAGHGQDHGVRTGGQHQLGIAHLLRHALDILKMQRLAGRIQTAHGAMRVQLHLRCLGHLRSRRGHQLGSRALLGQRVGQRGLGIKVRRIGADQDDGALGGAFAQLARCGPARQAGTHDDQGQCGVHAQTSTSSKSALATPQSGQAQLAGTSAHKVPGAMPSSGRPAASSYTKPHTMHT